MAAVQTFA